MKNKQFWGGVSLISISALVLMIDYALIHNRWIDILCLGSILKTGIFYLCLIGLVLSFYINRNDILNFSKFKNILKTLIKNTISGNILDILFVVFFLLNLTWIPDSVSDVLKENYSIWHPVIFVTGFVCAILSKPIIEKETTSSPLVLFTGISDIRDDNTTLFKPFFEYPSFEKVVVFIDEKIKILTTEITPSPTSGYSIHKDIIHSFIIQKLKEIPAYQNNSLVVEFHLCDYFDLKNTYDKISDIVETYLNQTYRDEHLLFNLTPGNKYISIALALNSIKSKRQYCYIRQNDGALETKELDVFEVKDIFSELTE